MKSDSPTRRPPTTAKPPREPPARFGPFVLDPVGLTLSKDGAPVVLPKQPVRLLAYLVARAGEVVTREELRDHLWADRVRDFDAGINTAIAQLRRVLGDDAGNPRFVETVPARGYRFLSNVSRDPHPGHSTQRSWWIAAGLLAGVLMLFGAWMLWPAQPVKVAVSVPQAAVEGMQNEARVLAQALVIELARFSRSHLVVGTEDAVAHDFSLTGELHLDGDQVMFNAFLTRNTDQRIVWGEQFRFERSRLHDAAPDEARKVAYALFTVLSGP